jgi:hypothetical protein
MGLAWCSVRTPLYWEGDGMTRKRMGQRTMSECEEAPVRGVQD